MLVKKIRLIINGDQHIIEYKGETASQLTRLIARDENELLDYMRTGNEKGRKAFCFQGLEIDKACVNTAKFEAIE